MSQCQIVCPPKSTYNAVNIKINNPRANVSDKAGCVDCDGEFNAINLEINNPELRQKPVYSYPEYDSVVTADMANVIPVEFNDVPVIPVAYETSYINIQTNAEPNELNEAESPAVPEPYVTSPENEKNLSFHGINFRATGKPEIIPDAGIKPAVDIDKVINNLESADYDVQAKQLEEIIYAALKDKNKAVSYITTPVFSGIISIAEKDTSSMAGPTEEQIDIRKRIITNEIMYEQQLAENKKPEEIKFPYEISDVDIAKAMDLSEMELAERNKEYALLTLSALTKVYADEFEKKVGSVVPLTDLPGISTMVETLKTSKNPSVRIAAIESLVYIYRPEYKDEISAVLNIASNDKNKAVAMAAAEALKGIN